MKRFFAFMLLLCFVAAACSCAKGGAPAEEPLEPPKSGRYRLMLKDGSPSKANFLARFSFEELRFTMGQPAEFSDIKIFGRLEFVGDRVVATDVRTRYSLEDVPETPKHRVYRFKPLEGGRLSFVEAESDELVIFSYKLCDGDYFQLVPPDSTRG